jgi:hypothetical protein
MRIFTRRRWLLFAVVACGLLATGTYWLTCPRLSINEETCAKIRLGMTRAEVEALIGGPPGYYGYKPEIALDPEQGPMQFWSGPDQFTIFVRFDDNRKVVSTGSLAPFGCGIAVEPSFLDRLRNWLGW